MQDSFGKDVDFYPIHGILVASTYGKTLFISPGKISTHCKENEMLVSSARDNKTKMYYKKSCDYDDDENARVTRVEITFIFNGEVQGFNKYVTVSGFTERELPSNEFPFLNSCCSNTRYINGKEQRSNLLEGWICRIFEKYCFRGVC